MKLTIDLQVQIDVATEADAERVADELIEAMLEAPLSANGAPFDIYDTASRVHPGDCDCNACGDR